MADAVAAAEDDARAAELLRGASALAVRPLHVPEAHVRVRLRRP